MRNTALVVLLALVACASPAVAEIDTKEAELNITTAGDLPFERDGVAQVRRLLERYDLGRWINTNDVVIQSRVIPHSHPVLTLNTRYVGGGGEEPDDVTALSVFVHEQGHWYFTAHQHATFAAIEELGRLFPETPSPENGGARDRESTLLHLMVCMLEYDAMVELVGPERTRELLGADDIYPWIYARILNDGDNARIRAVMATHRLNTY